MTVADRALVIVDMTNFDTHPDFGCHQIHEPTRHRSDEVLASVGPNRRSQYSQTAGGMAHGLRTDRVRTSWRSTRRLQ